MLPLTSPTRRAVMPVPSADLCSDGFLCLQKMSSACEDKDFLPALPRKTALRMEVEIWLRER